MRKLKTQFEESVSSPESSNSCKTLSGRLKATTRESSWSSILAQPLFKDNLGKLALTKPTFASVEIPDAGHSNDDRQRQHGT